MAENLEPVGFKAIMDVSDFRRDAGEYNNTVNEINRNTKGFTNTSQKEVPKSTKAMGNLAKVMGGALASAALAAGAAITKFAVDSVKAAADLEKQMSGVAAVLNLDTDQLKEANELVKSLGVNPNLTVRASEAAEAVEVLAKNGLSLEQILNGAAEASIVLSNATGADLASAADIATDAMVIFNIEANRMLDAVDSITGVTVNSKFDINDYALALSAAAGTAQSVGLSFEDMNTALVALSPNFTSGRTAGTALKGMLTRLEPTTKTAGAAFKELGLITEEGQNQFFTATGELKSLAEITDILNGAFGGLTEQQRINYATTIFGREAYNGVAALLRTSGEEVTALSAKVNDNTDATDQAAVRVDNLAGEYERFLSIVEGIKIEVGEAFTPIMRELTIALKENAGAISEFVSSDDFQNWVQNVSNGIRFLNGSLAENVEAQIDSRAAMVSSREELADFAADLQKMDREIETVTGAGLLERFADDFGGQRERILLETARISGSLEEFRENIAAIDDATGLTIINENRSAVIDEVAEAYEHLNGELNANAQAVRVSAESDAEYARLVASGSGAIATRNKAIAEEAEALEAQVQAKLAALYADGQYTKAQAAAVRAHLKAANAAEQQEDAYEGMSSVTQTLVASMGELKARLSETFLEQVKNVDSAFDLNAIISEQAELLDIESDALGDVLVANELLTDSQSIAAKARSELVGIEADLRNQLESGMITSEEYINTLASETAARRERIDAVVIENEKMEEQAKLQEIQEEMAVKAAEAITKLSQSLVGTFQSYELGNDSAEAFNQALFNGAVSAGSSVTELAALAAGLGLYTDEQIKAKLEAALFQVALDELSAQFSAGQISLAEYVDGARNVRDTLQENFTAVFEEEGIDGVIASASVIEEDLKRITAAQYGVEMFVDTAEAEARLDTLNAKSQLLAQGSSPKIKVDATTSGAVKEIKKANTAVAAITKKAPEIKFEDNTKELKEELDSTDERLVELVDEPRMVMVDDNLTDVSENADFTRSSLEAVSGNYAVEVDDNTNDTLDALDELDEALSNLTDSPYTINFEFSLPTDPTDPGSPTDPRDPGTPPGFFKDGGLIKGAPGTPHGRDVVPIIAMRNEGVLNRRAMRALGENNLDFLNRGGTLLDMLAGVNNPARFGRGNGDTVNNNDNSETVTIVNLEANYTRETDPGTVEYDVISALRRG